MPSLMLSMDEVMENVIASLKSHPKYPDAVATIHLVDGEPVITIQYN